MISKISSEIKSLGNKERAAVSQRFFKTGKGQYGEGDIFIGLTVPVSRMIAEKYADIPLGSVKLLLHSRIHEERLIALLILAEKFGKAGEKQKKEIVHFYLRNTAFVNNWDLVDLSADKIIGAYLSDKNRSVLYSLAKSENLWEKRIAIVSTFYFIRNNDFNETFKIAEILMKDRHDLIHKAVGWMLREAGKRDRPLLESFLKEHCRTMPRTMLRYAIEHFDRKKRLFFMSH